MEASQRIFVGCGAIAAHGGEPHPENVSWV
jgi:hypothetical protein